MTRFHITEGAIIGPDAATQVSACDLKVARYYEACARCGGKPVEAKEGYEGVTFYYIDHNPNCAAAPAINEFSWLVNPGQRHNATCNKIVCGPIWAKCYYSSMVDAGVEWVYCDMTKDDLDNLRSKIASKEAVRPSPSTLRFCAEMLLMLIGMFAFWGLLPVPSPTAGPFLF